MRIAERTVITRDVTAALKGAPAALGGRVIAMTTTVPGSKAPAITRAVEQNSEGAALHARTFGVAIL